MLESIKVKIKGKTYSYSKDITLQEIANEQQENHKYCQARSNTVSIQHGYLRCFFETRSVKIENYHNSLRNLHKCQGIVLYFEQNGCIM